MKSGTPRPAQMDVGLLYTQKNTMIITGTGTARYVNDKFHSDPGFTTYEKVHR